MSSRTTDWTQSSTAMRCERKGKYILNGITLAATESEALRFGTAWHLVAETDYTERWWEQDTWPVGRVLTSSDLDEDVINRIAVGIRKYHDYMSNVIDPTEWSVTCEGKLSYNGWCAKIDGKAEKNGDVYFMEHKSSAYLPNINKVEHFLVAEGQTSGQLYIGHGLYGDRFKGVFVIAYSHKKQQFKEYLLLPDLDRLAEFETDKVTYLAKLDRIDAMSVEETERNRYACMEFNRACEHYPVCWLNESVDGPKYDKKLWIPGEGYGDE